MSNDKPCAVATIKFYPNKHVDVELSDITNITPRTLDIASNLLMRKFRGMRGAYNAAMHKRAREERQEVEDKAVTDNIAFHDAEDKRLAEAALNPEPPDTERPPTFIEKVGELLTGK